MPSKAKFMKQQEHSQNEKDETKLINKSRIAQKSLSRTPEKL
jgi:hypothetical protein